MMTGLVSSQSEGRKRISDTVIGGVALSKFRAMMEAQGVSKETARALCSTRTDYYSILRKSECQMELVTQAEGKINDID